MLKTYITLFLTFAKIGAVTFGGGYAMLPMLQSELVDKLKYVTNDDLTDYFAIGQCTPGVIAVNTATFVGYKVGKTVGAVVATIGVIFPSMVIIAVIAAFISGFSHLAFVKSAFAGIRVCVCVLIFTSIQKLFKSAVIDKASFAIYIAVLALVLFTEIPMAALVLCAGAAGIVIRLLKAKKGVKEGEK